MKTLFFLFIASFFSTAAFAEFVSCKSLDNTIKVSLNLSDGHVSAVKFYRQVELRLIKESLPPGIYANLQDVNEQINWYFENQAYIAITSTNIANQARIQVFGESNESPRFVVLSKTVVCEKNLI